VNGEEIRAGICVEQLAPESGPPAASPRLGQKRKTWRLPASLPEPALAGGSLGGGYDSSATKPQRLGAIKVTEPAEQKPESSGAEPVRGEITLAEFQELIRRMYLPKDVARGIDGTFMWLIEEIGELAAALRHGTAAQRSEEFADVLAWLTTIANVAGVDLTAAVLKKYGSGCPGCGKLVCICPDAGKP